MLTLIKYLDAVIKYLDALIKYQVETDGENVDNTKITLHAILC